MTRFLMSACTIAGFAAFALPCLAQSNPWNGSWKADPSSMKLDGATFGVTVQPNGYTLVRAGKPEPQTVCDGKPHKDNMNTSDMVSCTKTANGYALEISHNGTRVAKAWVTVSGDTMTRKIDLYTSGQPTNTMTIHFRRTSGGPGVAGQWKEERFSESTDNGVLSIEVKGDSVAFKETDNVKAITCKLDGTPTKLPGGGSMAVTKAGARTLKVTYRGDDGKVRRENTFAVSADGKSMLETDVTPAPSHSVMSVTLHKM